MIWILQIPVCFGNESVVCKYFKVQTVLLQEQFHILMTAALNAKLTVHVHSHVCCDTSQTLPKFIDGGWGGGPLVAE